MPSLMRIKQLRRAAFCPAASRLHKAPLTVEYASLGARQQRGSHQQGSEGEAPRARRAMRPHVACQGAHGVRCREGFSGRPCKAGERRKGAQVAVAEVHGSVGRGGHAYEVRCGLAPAVCPGACAPCTGRTVPPLRGAVQLLCSPASRFPRWHPSVRLQVLLWMPFSRTARTVARTVADTPGRARKGARTVLAAAAAAGSWGPPRPAFAHPAPLASASRPGDSPEGLCH